MDLIENLRLNHTYCPKEVILAAADEIERLRDALARIECEPINAEYMARAALDVPNARQPVCNLSRPWEEPVPNAKITGRTMAQNEAEDA